MATFNGGKFIHEQISSILCQLGENDELVISDDSSSDDTIQVIESFHDKRIVLLPNQRFHSPILNFENALKHLKGDYVFLSDQDDVWESDKVKIMMNVLHRVTMVVSDCKVVDKDKNVIRESFCFNKQRSGNVIKNIISNNFLGCCMAFRRELLSKALPFPHNIAMHDIWLGLCASTFYSVEFIPDKLIMYRRHENNTSPTGEISHFKINYRINYRLSLIISLLKRKYLKHV